MSRGPGRVERAIRALFDTHPDGAFTVDRLCVECYDLPDMLVRQVRQSRFRHSNPVQPKHRVATIRAAWNVAKRDPNIMALWTLESGRQLVFFNQTSIAATMAALALRNGLSDYDSRYTSAKVLTLLRDAAEEWMAEYQERRDKHDAASVAEASKLLCVIGRQPTLMKDAGRHLAMMQAYTLKRDAAAIAARCRALAEMNDPDAVRAGLAQIADTLDGMTGGRDMPEAAE